MEQTDSVLPLTEQPTPGTAEPFAEESTAVEEQEISSPQQEADPPSRSDAALHRLCTRYGVAGGDLEALVGEVERLAEHTRLQQMQLRSRQEAEVYGTYRRLLAEQQQLQQLDPHFSWQTALQDPRFAALLGHPFLSAVQVYQTLYAEDLMTRAARQGQQQGRQEAYRRMLHAALRPTENGTKGQGAAQIKQDVSQMTKEQRHSLLRRARRGERVSL